MTYSKIGFIGLGLMGIPMAKRLISAGFPVYIWNRTKEKSLAIEKEGVTVVSSPAQLASEVDVILICITDGEAVKSILFSTNGVLAGARKNQIIVDHSTILPNVAQEISQELEKHDIYYVDAPVTGSVPGATNGTLTVFAGGDFEVIKKVEPILLAYSKKVNYMGQSGAGQSAKICNQTMLINTAMLIFETVNLAKNQGIEPKLLLDAFRDTLIDSKAVQIFGEYSITDNPKKLAHIKDVLKDLSYVNEVAQSTKSHIFLTEKTLQLVKEFSSRGNGYKDIIELKKLYS